MSELPRLAYSREEAAEVCGVSVDLIDRAIASGALAARRTATDSRGRPAGRVLVTEQALRDWLEQLPDALTRTARAWMSEAAGMVLGMAIIVNRGNENYDLIESGTTVDVGSTGNLVVYAGGHRVAAYPAGQWFDAAKVGDYKRVNGKGEPHAEV